MTWIVNERVEDSNECFGSGNEWIPSKEIAQGLISGFTDADAAGDFYGWSCKAVLAEPETGMRGGKVAAVVAEAGDAKCLSEASWAGGKADEITRGADFEVSGASHLFYALKGFKGTEENAPSFAFGLTGDIQAIVVAVDEIDVSMAGRSEEDGVTSGFSGSGVGGGVVFSKVGFDLDNTGAEAGRVSADQELSEEVASDATGIAGEEGAREWLAGAKARIPCEGFTGL